MTRRGGAIAVGLIGASTERGWATMAHIPAPGALPSFEIAAVCTTRRASADAVAAQFGIPRAFVHCGRAGPRPGGRPGRDHRQGARPPRGRGGGDRRRQGGLLRMVGRRDAGRDGRAARPRQARGGPHDRRPAVALDPGPPPSARLGRRRLRRPRPERRHALDRPAWGAAIGQADAYTLDRANGATLLSIWAGHSLDLLCHCLGELVELSALVTTQRETVRIVETGERVPMTSPDQVIVHGQLEGGAVAVHLRGGRLPGTGFLLEVTGTDGMLVVEGAGPFAMVLSELTLAGARGEAAELTSMEVPERYRRGCGYGRNDREQIADLLRELRAAADLVAGARRG